MQSLRSRLTAGDVLLCDGAMGTMLFQRGLQSGQCPEALNLSEQHVLEEIARAYLEAGADLLETNTFGGSSLKLAQYGLDAQTAEINQRAVEAVRKVCGDRALVAGSCGPTGRLLTPYGDTEPDEVRDSFRQQIGALLDAGADLIILETMTDLAEARQAVLAARDASTEVPVAATMTFDPTPRGFFTIMGVDPTTAVTGLLEAGADVIGSNCGNGIDRMVEIARQLRAAGDAPLIIQSNAGLPENRGGELIYPESPEYMAGWVDELVQAGVQIIGGCCGTTPEHIRAMRAALAPHCR